LFTKNISMEHTSDRVYEGKLIHGDSYGRMKKEILIGDIKIDFIKKDSGLVVHEVKEDSITIPSSTMPYKIPRFHRL